MVKARLGADVVKTKASRGDLLTEVDGAAERLIEARVRAAFPTHAFLGEESVAAGAKASAEAIAAAMDAAFDAMGGGAASEAQSSASGSGSVSASTSSAPGDDWLWIVDPIDGTTLTAMGRGNAISVIAVSERGSMFNPGPCVYMEKIAVGPEAATAIDLNVSPTKNLKEVFR
jgi:fructose-1,6-bisphosphatase/inositol monophosphatase family enzyme